MTAAGFEVFLTVDQGVRYQQNLKSAAVAVIVMVASSNDIANLLPIVPNVLLAMTAIQSGEIVEVRA